MTKKCNHEFTHAVVSNWLGAAIKVYCKKCGIDADDLPRNRFKRLFRR